MRDQDHQVAADDVADQAMAVSSEYHARHWMIGRDNRKTSFPFEPSEGCKIGRYSKLPIPAPPAVLQFDGACGAAVTTKDNLSR
jgi:hypothetical protein